MSKPTFAELLAAKKASLAANQSATTTTTKEPEPEKVANPFLAKLASTTPAQALTPTPAPVEEEAKVAAIPKLTIDSDIIAKSNAVIAAGSEIDAEVESSTTEEIRTRIERLADMPELDLKQAMDGLKALILANPSACAQLLPEDVGDMVTALRRMTNNTVAAALAPAKRGRAATKKEPILAADDLDALLGDLGL